MFELYKDSVRQTKLRAILRDFFVVYQAQTPQFLEAEVYEMMQDETFKRFWFKKGRIYEDDFTYQDLNDTLLEQVLLNGEEQYYYQTSHLLDIKQKTNKTSNLVYAKPIFSGLKLQYVLLLFLEEELSELTPLDYLELKLISVTATKETEVTNEQYEALTKKQGIRLFHKKDLTKEVAALFSQVLEGYDRTIKQDSTYYQLYALDDNWGYTVDITEKMELEVREQLAHLDPESKLFGLRKLLEDIDGKSVLYLKFQPGYFIDVINKLKPVYPLYQGSNGLFLKLDTHDKRKVNKVVHDIQTRLGVIPTFDVQIGILRIGQDVSKFDSDLLEKIASSGLTYYDQLIHVEEVTKLQRKKFLYNALLNGSYQAKVYPIRTLGNIPFALFYPTIEVFDDLRMELLFVQHVLKKFANDKTTLHLMLAVSDDLLNHYDLVDYLKTNYANNHFLKRLTFVFEEKHETFERYLRDKHVTIGRSSFEAVLKQEIAADYLFLKLPYQTSSNPLMDVLTTYQEKGIVQPIFQIDDRDDYYYLVENQIGYVYEIKE